jgi:MFS family permease
MSSASSSDAIEAPSAPVETAAPAKLSPAAVRRGLRFSMFEGALATVTISITGSIGGSVFLTGYALLLGANDFQLGLLGALPFIGQLFQFVAAYLEERVGQRRPLVLYSSLFGRLLWLPLLAIPFLGLPVGLQIGLFLALLACSYALNGMAGNAWMSWMSDLVPARERGRYFGLRNTLVSVSTMISTYTASRILDLFRAQNQETLGYATIFAIACVFAIAAALLIAQQPEPPYQRRERIPARQLFSAPLKDDRFRRFAFVSTAWALVTGISAPFFNAHGLNGLNLSFELLALTAIATSAVALFTQPLIGQLQDKFGDRTVMLICLFGTVPLPWGWVLSTPDNIIPLWLTSIFSGIFWPGITQGMMNLLMANTPAEGRGAFMASYGAITGVGTLVAGLLGGTLASLLSPSFSIGMVPFTNLTLLFALSSVGRLATALLAWRKL